MFAPVDVTLLADIGCTAQELFDFLDESMATMTLLVRLRRA
jgi:hypothetical protein